MVLAGIGAAGSALVLNGARLLRDADAAYDLSSKYRFGGNYIARDSSLADRLLDQAHSSGVSGSRWIVAGVAVLAIAIPVLWLWFGARRGSRSEVVLNP